MASKRKTKKAYKKMYRAALDRAGIPFVKVKRRARNIAGFIDAGGTFHPIRSGTRYIEKRTKRGYKEVAVKDRTPYSRKKAGEKNPSRTLLFRSKKAAQAYARAHRSPGMRVTVRRAKVRRK